MDLLLSHLSHIYSLDAQARHNAEAFLNASVNQHGFANALTQVLVRTDLHESVRQHVAGVLLRQFVDTRWCELCENFQAGYLIPSDEEKKAIKDALPSSLGDPSIKIRTSAAMCIAAIAAWDWPQSWPGFMESLVGCLSHSDPNLVHGAMKCLDMFATGKNMSDQHLPVLVNVAFPVLLKVYSARETFPWNVRMRCVSVLFSVVRWIATMAKVHQDGRAKVLDPILPQWFAVFKQDLAEPDAYDRPHAVKIRILQVLSVMLQELPNLSAKLVPQLLPFIWGSLVSAVGIWQGVAIEDTVDDPSHQDEETGDKLGFDPYVSMLIEVILIMTERKRFHSLLGQGVPDLLYVCMSLGQLTESQAEDYESDINEFVANEYSEMGAFNVRSSTADLCQMIGQQFFDKALHSLQLATSKCLNDIAPIQNTKFYWKRREGLEYVVGHVFAGFYKAAQDRMMYEEVDLQNLQFDLDGFLKSVLTVDVDPRQHPLLRGRALWCAARLLGVGEEMELDHEGRPAHKAAAEKMEMLKAFLTNAAHTIQQQNVPLALRLIAAGSLASLAPMLPAADSVLSGAVGGILPHLVQTGQHVTDEALHMILETLSLLIPLDPNSTVAVAPQMVPTLIHIWGEHLDDPFVSQLVNENVAALAKINGMLPHLQMSFGPILHQVLANPHNEQLPGVVETAADIVQSLVISSGWPLPEVLMNQVFPIIANRMLSTIDNGFLQSGCSALLAYIRCAKDNLLNWNDGHANGVEYVLRALERVLSPQLDDSAALYVGPLISKLLENLGNQLGAGVTQILAAALNRLHTARMPSLQQALILVFIKLLRTNPAPTVQFLTSTQIDGQSGLQFLLVTWMAMHEEFHGSFHINNSIFAMSKLFNEPSLDSISVPGDLPVNTSEKISTRSKSKAPKRQMEPLKVRIFKLLVREHMVIIEDMTRPQELGSDEDDDGEFDAEDHVIHDENSTESFIDFEAALDDGLIDDAYDDDDEETDPDILADPVYKLDLKQYIETFFQEFFQHNPQAFNMFAGHLTNDERAHLQKYVFSNQNK